MVVRDGKQQPQTDKNIRAENGSDADAADKNKKGDSKNATRGARDYMREPLAFSAAGWTGSVGPALGPG